MTTQQEFIACRSGKPPWRCDLPCVYLGAGQADSIFACSLHGKCTIKSNDQAIAACADCKDYLRRDHKQFPAKFQDPLKITDRNKTPTNALRGMLADGCAFLVCGGPSLKSLPYQRLAERGVFSLGINNVAGLIPVSAFTCSDPPSKFHWGIFADPKIMKFLPIPKIGKSKTRGQLRKKVDGEFQWLDRYTATSPNVWGFERRSWLMPDHTFFTEPSASWGNQQAGVDRTGLPKTACTMLLGLRLLYYLGARRVFLLGCDFKMHYGVGLTKNYAFDEKRDEDAVSSNNEQYRIVNEWLSQLRPTFERFGLEVYNCYQHSGLRAFSYVPFNAALELCRGDVPRGEFDLHGWYEKK